MTYLSRRVNRRQVIRGSALGLVGVGGAALIGCSSDDSSSSGAPSKAGTSAAGAAAGTPKKGGELVLNQAGDPPSMDPQKSTSNNSTRIARAIYSQLVRYDATTKDPVNLKVTPHVAESWELVDPRTYRFKLRGDVNFHDIAPVSGRLMTSEDVKVSFDQLRGAKSPVRGVYSPIASIETPDDRTVVFKLTGPFAPFLTVLAEPQTSYLGSKEIFAADGDLTKRYIGTGPFTFGQFEAGTKLTHPKNPKYFEKGFPHLDRITHVIQNDTSALVSAFASGKLHSMSSDPITQPQLQRLVPKMTSVDIAGSSSNSIAMQNQIAPFTDVRVRKAVVKAVNQQRLVDVGYKGAGDISGAIPPGIAQFVLPAAEVKAGLAQDVAESKRLLAAAGHPNGFSTEIMLISTGGDEYNAVAQLVQQDLAAVGIKANLRVEEQAIGRQKGIDGQFQMYDVAGRITGLEADFFIRDAFFSTSTRNWSFGKDAKLDDMIIKQSETTNEEERKKILWDIQRYLMNDLTPELFLPAAKNTFVVRPEVRDYYPSINSDRSNETFAWLDA